VPPPSDPTDDEPPVEPDDPGEPTPIPADDEEAEPAGEPELADLLPTERDLPAGLVAAPLEQRTLDDVAQNLGVEDAELKLNEWGWDGNVVQAFALPADVPPAPGATTNVIVSVHRFASPTAASEAFIYFSNILMDTGAYEEFDSEPIGDEIRLLKGSPEGALLAVAYVRDGEVLYRIGGSSPDGDPEEDVKTVARAVVAQ
jgi:hypothetical protein